MNGLKRREVYVRDIILITPNDFNLNELACCFDRDYNFRITSDLHRITFEDLQERHFVGIEKQEYMTDLYAEDEESEIFKNVIPEPDFYLVTFKDIESLKRILLRSLDRPDVYLDNDFGLILPGNEFSNTLRRRPGWDWAFE